MRKPAATIDNSTLHIHLFKSSIFQTRTHPTPVAGFIHRRTRACCPRRGDDGAIRYYCDLPSKEKKALSAVKPASALSTPGIPFRFPSARLLHFKKFPGSNLLLNRLLGA